MVRKQRRAILIGATVCALAVATPAAGLVVDMAGHWAAPLIGALQARGIVSGDEDFRFNPEAVLTRAQLAKLMAAGLGNGEDAGLLSAYPSRFNDVPKWHWANGYIEALAETGEVEGYPDGTFQPENAVTRAQLAVIFVRAAGLADQARVMQFEQTGYSDDADVPGWARGAVRVARVTGLMNGFADNSFKPLQSVTRAEGSVALSRLLNLKGRVFNLTGTLVRFDPTTRTGTVRDFFGETHPFVMAQGAQYFRGGLPSHYGQIRPLDQVWIVLGPDGTGSSLDARYADLLGQHLHASDSALALTAADGTIRSMAIEPGALVFLNGRPASGAETDQASLAYVALNVSTGDVRMLDAVTVTLTGKLIGVDLAKNTIVLENESGLQTATAATDVISSLNGERVALSDLHPDDRVQLAQNKSGLVEYVMAER